MGKWPLVRLGDVCEIGAGQGAPQGVDKYCRQGTPFIKAGNLADLVNGCSENEIQQVNDEVAKEYALRIYPKGTIVFAKSGMSCMKGYVYKLKRDCYVVNHLACVIPRKVYGSYLKYCLEKYPPNRLIKDASYPSLSLSDIANLKIPLPPLNVQKHIANVLDKTQEIIDSHKKQLAELDNLIKAVFYKMFGDPVTNEKGLKAAKIKDFFIVKSGSTPNRNCNEYWKDGSIPWIKTTEIKENYIYSSEEYITELAAKECRLTRMPKGTILVAMYGQGQTRGRTAKLMVNATINQACAALVKKNDNINVDFVWHFLMISYEQLRSLGRGGNQPNLNKSLVENFEILIPDISLQTKFADIVTKIEEQKALVKQAITESEHLFNSLMSEYFD